MSCLADIWHLRVLCPGVAMAAEIVQSYWLPDCWDTSSYFVLMSTWRWVNTELGGYSQSVSMIISVSVLVIDARQPCLLASYEFLNSIHKKLTHNFTSKQCFWTKDGDILCAICRLAAEWHHDNPAPESIAQGSKRAFLWTCPACKHDYKAEPGHRSNRFSGCPLCARERQVKGGRPLFKDDRPDLAAEFVSQENSRSLESLTCGSSFRATFKCRDCGTKFQRTVWERVRANMGCPSCASQVRVGNRPVGEVIAESKESTKNAEEESKDNTKNADKESKQTTSISGKPSKKIKATVTRRTKVPTTVVKPSSSKAEIASADAPEAPVANDPVKPSRARKSRKTRTANHAGEENSWAFLQASWQSLCLHQLIRHHHVTCWLWWPLVVPC